jgi:Excinuclease ATPase subunit
MIKLFQKEIILEITSRLNYLNDVGLNYLTLNRFSKPIILGEILKEIKFSNFNRKFINWIYVYS